MSISGDKAAFLKIIQEHRGIIYRICHVYTDTPEDWKDLSQEILAQLWTSHASFEGRSAFSTWMYRVALNTALMHRRKNAKRPESTELKDHHLIAEFEDDEEVKMLYSCIHRLKKLDRAIVLLHLEQKTYNEIAAITGLSSGAVSVRLVRIREKLKTCLLSMGIKEGAE